MKQTEHTAEPVVQTTAGKVRGREKNGVMIFSGIPYGADCDGENRFLPPKPASCWSGIRDCTENGAIAWQIDREYGGGSVTEKPNGVGRYFSGGIENRCGSKTERRDENCLVLNVLTQSMTEKRPVLVYLHGGALEYGSGALCIGADQFVREQGLVLVSVNHRLNFFGYLYLGALDGRYASSGISGILDILLALQWVRANIVQFGGDPDRVTLMGESGGCMKVNMLLSMPAARGLFCAAVCESGQMPILKTSKQQAAAYTEQVMQALGVKKSEWKKLLEIPPQRFIELLQPGEKRLPLIPRWCAADGIWLTENQTPFICDAGYMADVPVLLGCSEDETARWNDLSFLRTLKEAHLRASLLAPVATLSVESVQKIRCTEENIDAVLHVLQETGDGQTAGHKYQRVGSYVEGCFEQAMQLAGQPGRKSDVYCYLVTKDFPCPEMPEDPLLRFSWHTADLPLQLRIVADPESEDFSRRAAQALGTFVRTGSPSSQALRWPAFDPVRRLTLVWGEKESHIERDPQQKLREALYGSEADTKIQNWR